MIFKSKKPARAIRNPVFNYTSTCCSAPAEKPPCATEVGQVTGVYLGSKPTGESSLGTFRCTQCRKPARVTRSKTAPTPEPANV